ncbi:MAG: hypothetical protein AB8H80_10275 [Planctomycetota bacterium]
MLRFSFLTMAMLLASCANPNADANVASPADTRLTGSSPTYLMTSAQSDAQGDAAKQAIGTNSDRRPPIDRSAPAQFQTATFALG